ncbi:peptidoglycan-binding protein [Actinomadura macrotermitis]|uniref:Peptidoglycan binding-like domain-containing protein n=1 Tax=Actinomadura macrotermitis TaxID=2585200 RepID=A0A7K0C7F7_9ACTN|nr:peptidoglycan-binding protein [Actinomadura macrotermitis]MQY09348.1 hypothetical protein [Actinomadura macrotermitis]
MNALPAPLQSGTGEAGGPGGPRRGRRRRAALIVGTVMVIGGATGYALLDDEAPASPGGAAQTGLATVTQGRLSARTSVSGTLGYRGGYKVVNQAAGMYTRLPKAGEIIAQGAVLYRVDGRPVIFLRGSATPLYRDLRLGMEGADVRQLNAALVDMGYGGDSGLNPRSSYFSWATREALKKLQDDLDIKENGVLAKDQAVFLPDDKIRVTSVGVTAGAPAAAGNTVLEAGSRTRQVNVALDASLQSQVKAGDKVTITLPNLKTVPGTVSSVGTVAKKNSSGGATVDAAITPAGRKAAGALDQAPVQVSIVTESVDDALAVPVNALLALLNGGYGLEVADGSGARRLVPVTLGLFDDTAGTVQVTGPGVSAGLRVVVPAS